MSSDRRVKAIAEVLCAYLDEHTYFYLGFMDTHRWEEGGGLLHLAEFLAERLPEPDPLTVAQSAEYSGA